MKTMFLALSVLLFATLTASAQYAGGRNQRGNNPTTGGNYSNSSGAQYAVVDAAAIAAGTYNQGNAGNFRQQGRRRGGAQYVAVSVAPRRR